MSSKNIATINRIYEADEPGNFEGPFTSATPSELSRVTTEPETTNYAVGHSPTEIMQP
jgi:hypothetical protein